MLARCARDLPTSSPKTVPLSGLESQAKSLFQKILVTSVYSSTFCGHWPYLGKYILDTREQVA